MTRKEFNLWQDEVDGDAKSYKNISNGRTIVTNRDGSKILVLEDGSSYPLTRGYADSILKRTSGRKQNPSIGLPRNKWVNAKIRVTSAGKIQAAVSEDILGAAFGRKKNKRKKR